MFANLGKTSGTGCNPTLAKALPTVAPTTANATADNDWAQAW